jgi:hypothetical protein
MNSTSSSVCQYEPIQLLDCSNFWWLSFGIWASIFAATALVSCVVLSVMRCVQRKRTRRARQDFHEWAEGPAFDDFLEWRRSQNRNRYNGNRKTASVYATSDTQSTVTSAADLDDDIDGGVTNSHITMSSTELTRAFEK